MSQRLLFDGHLDLAWNALSLNRDLTEPLKLIRQREQGLHDTQSRGNAMVCLPAMRDGQVGFCLPTILVRARRSESATLRCDMNYGTQAIANCIGWAQRQYYELLEQQGHIRMLTDAENLGELIQTWKNNSTQDSVPPIGCILSMEGADPILTPDDLHRWWDAGLRVLSLVHYGEGPYAAGTSSVGPITHCGIDLLRAMHDLGIILDVTHLSDDGFDQALDIYDGPVIATHSNCREIAPHQRQLSDEQIRRLIERDAIIGVALDIWMLRSWPSDLFTEDGFASPKALKLLEPSRHLATLADVARHLDHICQIAGNSRHVAIGSDLDGGFGTEQAPCDMDTIANLQQLAKHLINLGYPEHEIDGIFSGHWLAFFLDHLPSSSSTAQRGK